MKDSGKSPELALKASVAPPSTLNKNHRRSERVFLNLPVRIFVPGERGEDFFGEGQTVDISHDGAAIMLNRELRVGQTIKIRCVSANKEALAQVVAYKDHDSNARVFGIAFADDKANLWDIAFPASPSLETAVLRALLRCVACGRLEVAYLNEFESELFLNHHSVARLCARCGGWTTWTRPYGSLRAGSDGGTESGLRNSHAPNQNHRSHGRVRVETVGCIRNPALGNEVVLVSDLARGGLSFFSANDYPDGAQIEMAIPYTSKAPNIYCLVRVVSSRKGNDDNLKEYRAAYLE